MTYAEAKRAEYPPQDEAELLIEFTTELLARSKFAATGHAGVSWDEWIGTDEDTREDRLSAYRVHSLVLAGLGMLAWPETETRDVSWIIESPGHYRGLSAVPALDRIVTFGRDAKAAVAYFRACTTVGQPCRLSWSFAQAPGHGRG
ncbi:hypothetical protein GCM10023063_17530 [Arthrobacter methylotrophus]|uniref:Uncharacterized protein n=1 Tax=Arthrobacter methylotrophus TaxID=121291 RepID=A0ABV5UNS4_9MICC